MTGFSSTANGSWILIAHPSVTVRQPFLGRFESVLNLIWNGTYESASVLFLWRAGAVIGHAWDTPDLTQSLLLIREKFIATMIYGTAITATTATATATATEPTKKNVSGPGTMVNHSNRHSFSFAQMWLMIYGKLWRGRPSESRHCGRNADRRLDNNGGETPGLLVGPL